MYLFHTVFLHILVGSYICTVQHKFHRYDTESCIQLPKKLHLIHTKYFIAFH